MLIMTGQNSTCSEHGNLDQKRANNDRKTHWTSSLRRITTTACSAPYASQTSRFSQQPASPANQS